jgi:hypothetical protein
LSTKTDNILTVYTGTTIEKQRKQWEILDFIQKVDKLHGEFMLKMSFWKEINIKFWATMNNFFNSIGDFWNDKMVQFQKHCHYVQFEAWQAQKEVIYVIVL